MPISDLRESEWPGKHRSMQGHEGFPDRCWWNGELWPCREFLVAENERLVAVVQAATAWVDELQTWAEDVSETDQVLIDAVDNYRIPPALDTREASDGR